ncbi:MULTISPECIES: DUF1707 and DUF4190 domain-containing protein [Streptomyces]|uniref:DUF1707 and DUF4190 domain-containing protein n=1 Tax=Streptomyces TaxID=1883 RepID=UPI002F950979
MAQQQPWGQPYPAHPQKYGPPAAWQPAPAPVPAAGPFPASAMRASHTDRDRTVDVLKAAFAEGRLSHEEYGQRFDAAARAQTYGELARLVADLPAGPMQGPFGALPAAVPPAFAPHPPPLVMPPPQRRVNGLAIASLVMGVMSLPTFGVSAPGAVITGHIAKAQVRARGEEGAGMATVGLVLGWLAMGGWVLLILLAAGGA